MKMTATKRRGLLVAVVGPTAVGKTAFSVLMAKALDTVVLSADSRQFFAEMQIGTARPTEKDMQGIPHYFIGTKSIEEEYNAGSFEKEALCTLERLYKEKPVTIMAGGSGMYVDAVCQGMDKMPPVDKEVREKLNRRLEAEGLPSLVVQLAQIDPEYHDMVDKNNPQRVIRALEVYFSSGQLYSSFRKRNRVKRPFDILKIGLEVPREVLYQRIDERMDLMISEGLFQEAERLYPYRHKNALQTVGYKEIHDYIDGMYDKEEAIRLLKRNSRRYAKRQMTWFKRDETVCWMHPSESERAITLVNEKLGKDSEK